MDKGARFSLTGPLNVFPFMLYVKEKKHLLLRIRQVEDVYVKRTKTCLFRKMFESFV